MPHLSRRSLRSSGASDGSTVSATRWVLGACSGVGAAETAHGTAELLGALQVADVPRARYHDQLGIRDRFLELPKSVTYPAPRGRSLMNKVNEGPGTAPLGISERSG